ncbi:Hypothetical predicted protein [Olea europaea subsp. europaea]|uniref:Uncharacterized protein n=1 Tax=Olea europaea subsp. europaea TaxID=158383 RepID=A0A8S0TL18_OLEEU|nr:Hypothetical predicted protein [Olea europaea subsp. europaea]
MEIASTGNADCGLTRILGVWFAVEISRFSMEGASTGNGGCGGNDYSMGWWLGGSLVREGERTNISTETQHLEVRSTLAEVFTPRPMRQS